MFRVLAADLNLGSSGRSQAPKCLAIVWQWCRRVQTSAER